MFTCKCGYVFSDDLGKYGCPNCCGENGAAKLYTMKKLIDLDEETIKTLSHMAIEAGTNLKVYIQAILVVHANAKQIWSDDYKKIKIKG